MSPVAAALTLPVASVIRPEFKMIGLAALPMPPAPLAVVLKTVEPMETVGSAVDAPSCKAAPKVRPAKRLMVPPSTRLVTGVFTELFAALIAPGAESMTSPPPSALI